MVKHNGLTVEIVSQTKDVTANAPTANITSTNQHLVVQQSFVLNGSNGSTAHNNVQPAFKLRIGSEPTDRTIRAHVTVSSNGVPLSWHAVGGGVGTISNVNNDTHPHQHSCVLQAKGLYDGQWRDRGLWHEVPLPTPINHQYYGALTVQVHFYETVASSTALTDNGPLLQIMTMHLIQQHTIVPMPMVAVPKQRTTSGYKRPEQSFGYDQKAMYWKRRRVSCSSESMELWTSNGATTTASTTTTATNGGAGGDCGMVMG